MKYNFLILTSLLALFLTPGVSAEYNFSKEYLNQWKKDFPNARWVDIKSSANPRALIINPSDVLNNDQFNALAEFNMRRLNQSILVVAQGDEVIFEKYEDQLDADSTRTSFSMWKSINAITIGVALCQGKIADLNDYGRTYLPRLRGTSWGRSTIRQMLMMSSGASDETNIYNGHISDQNARQGGSVALGKGVDDVVPLMKSGDEKAHEPGFIFKYNNFDSWALAMIAESVSGRTYPEFFESDLIPLLRLQNPSRWMVYRSGQVSKYSATPHDWIRIGRFVMEQIKDTDKDSCLRDYIYEMTTKQIEGEGKLDKGYGYQTWIGCGESADFCFLGWGGQYLLFNIEKDIVTYVHSMSEIPTGIETFWFFDNVVQRLEN